jgi:hypothetical protein
VASGSYDCEPSNTNATFGDTNRLPPLIVAINEDDNTLTTNDALTELLEDDAFTEKV